ncbi:MAG: GDSL-type esterase/lipase family protein [Limisphaerales bacterium]
MLRPKTVGSLFLGAADAFLAPLLERTPMIHPERQTASDHRNSCLIVLAHTTNRLKPGILVATLVLLCCGDPLLRANDERDDSPTKSTVSDFWDEIPKSPSTTIPEAIRDGYWRSQFQRVNQAIAKAEDPQVVFFGDSITLRWSLLKAEGKSVWQERFAKYTPINMGNSGDITPVMLYRVTHGNLGFARGREPRVAVILAGTNNYVVRQSDRGRVKWDLGIDTPPSDVAHGVRAIAQQFRRRLPRTRHCARHPAGEEPGEVDQVRGNEPDQRQLPLPERRSGFPGPEGPVPEPGRLTEGGPLP